LGMALTACFDPTRPPAVWPRSWRSWGLPPATFHLSSLSTTGSTGITKSRARARNAPKNETVSLARLSASNASWVGLSIMWNAMHPSLMPAVFLNLVRHALKNHSLGLLTYARFIAERARSHLAPTVHKPLHFSIDTMTCDFPIPPGERVTLWLR
jgi:hypothetical protein